MAAKESDQEYTYRIAKRSLELMKTHRSPANPLSYEVWYSYVSAEKPMLIEEMKRLIAERGEIDGSDIYRLYDKYISPQRLTHEAQRVSAGVLDEIDGVMSVIDNALGSTAEYGQSLENFSNDLSTSVDRTRIREIVQSLVVATREISTTNRILETHLRETRDEISDLRVTLESVRVEALTDALTGIANRKHLEEMLFKGVMEAAEHGTPLTLIVIDIDFFKRFNDTFGHLTGDQVLRLVSQSMRDQVNAKATLARFGGEEFAVVLPNQTIQTAREIAERIRNTVMSRELIKRSTGESLGKITVSLGVAAFTKDDTALTLLERADKCLYRAKETGRNRTVCDYEDTMPEAVSEVA